MILKNFVGECDGSGRFVVKCSVCGRTYLQINLPVGQTFHYELPMPQVPCHADGLEVTSPDESPWDRVSRLFDLTKKKPEGSEKFQYTMTMQDGMIYQVSIQRTG